MAADEENTSAKSSQAPGSPSSVLELDDLVLLANCDICTEGIKQPKVLTCLHSFCEECLEKQVRDAGSKDALQPEIITCPKCRQESKVPAKGVVDLVTDYVLCDILDGSSLEDMALVCNSCKATEKAVAQCMDCASYLCTNCVTAHQYMRLFDNHKVVTFEEMENLGGKMSIHKPIYCSVHPSEILKQYCNTCQVAICSDCVHSDHIEPLHSHDRIIDVEVKMRQEIKTLITESQGKISYCQEVEDTLQGALTDLQSQRDNAEGLITETFHSYKAILEKQQAAMLEQLEEIHLRKELTIMDMFETVGRTSEKIEDGCKFTERVLEKGSGLQLLLMRKLIVAQLLSLINNTPKPDLNVKIEFHSDLQQFTDAVAATFGSFNKDEPKAETRPSSLQSSFENEFFSLHSSGVEMDPGTAAMMPHISAPEFIPKRTTTPISSLGMGPIGSIMGMAVVGSRLPSSIQAGSTPSIPENMTFTSSLTQSPGSMSDSGIAVDHGNPALPNFDDIIQTMSQSIQGSKYGQQLPPLGGFTGLPILGTNHAAERHSPQFTATVHNRIPRAETPNMDSVLKGLWNLPPPPEPASTDNVLVQRMDSIGSRNMMGQSAGMSQVAGSMGTMSCGSSSPVSGMHGNMPFPPVRRNGKMSPMQIRCKFGQLGPGKGQFNSPHGFCLSAEEDVVVADTNNHRIQVFDKTGEFKYQFGIPGREEGQLWYPRKVAVFPTSGKFVVCDRGNERSRMQIFSKTGHFVKKIAIRYIDIVAGLAINQEGDIVAVDSVTPSVFRISEAGMMKKFFDCSEYMREPSDIAIKGHDYYVCDFKGHCVVVFDEEGQFLRRIGCENITNYPNGIEISDAGDVLIGDSHGNRFHVAVFQHDGSLIGEFECPYVKVSRCCGLKITSDGYVVTLAKNNHHVLVLNTLYIN